MPHSDASFELINRRIIIDKDQERNREMRSDLRSSGHGVSPIHYGSGEFKEEHGKMADETSVRNSLPFRGEQILRIYEQTRQAQADLHQTNVRLHELAGELQSNGNGGRGETGSHRDRAIKSRERYVWHGFGRSNTFGLGSQVFKRR